MKVLSSMVLVVVLLVGLAGCGRTLAELRVDSDAVVDNATGVANQTISTVGTVAKQLIRAGFAVYDIAKSMFQDSEENVETVVKTVTGAGNTPNP